MVAYSFSVLGQTEINLPSEDFINDVSMSQDGNDLILTSKAGEVIVVQEYFSGPDMPSLTSPAGGVLSANLVESFVKPNHAGEYADASNNMNDVSPAGQMTEVVGEVWIMRADGTRIEAKKGTLVFEGDVIETSENGAVNMIFADNSSFAISDGARLSVDEYIYDSEAETGSSFFSMLKGAFVYTSGVIGKEDPEDVNIETPVGSIGIRGTVIIGNINPAGQTSEITVIDGAIVVSNAAGVVELNNNFETVQLSAYTDPAVNIGQVDSNYINSNYNFDNSLSSYSGGIYNTTTTNTSSTGATTGDNTDTGTNPVVDSPTNTDGNNIDTQPVLQEEGGAGSIIDGQQPIIDGLAPQLSPQNPLVQQMIDYKIQQQIDGTAEQFLVVDNTNIIAANTGEGTTTTTTTRAVTITGGIDEAPVILDIIGIDGDGTVTYPFNTNQLESIGTIIGRIDAVDPESAPLRFNITNVQNLTDGVDATSMFNITPDGYIVITDEITTLASTGDVDLAIDFAVSDVSGNVTNLTDIRFQVNWLGGAISFGNTAATDAVATTVYGGAGNNSIYGTDDVGDVLLGGIGSDLFQIGDLNFQLIDGGIQDEVSANVDTGIYQSTNGRSLIGDSLSFGFSNNINLTTGSGNEVKFENIDNFLLQDLATTTLNIDAAAVARMTDPDNVLHIWSANSTSNAINFSGDFSMGASGYDAVTATVTQSYIGYNGATVIVHETNAGDVNVTGVM